MSISSNEIWESLRQRLEARLSARAKLPGLVHEMVKTSIEAILDGDSARTQYMHDVLSGDNLPRRQKEAWWFDQAQYELLSWLLPHFGEVEARSIDELIELFAVDVHGSIFQILSGKDRILVIDLVAKRRLRDIESRMVRY